MMHNRFLIVHAFTAVALMLGAGSARAGLTTYTDRDTFLASLPGAAIYEGFEDEVIDVQAGSRAISLSTSQVQFAGSGDALFGVNNVVIGGRGPTEGSNYLQVGFLNTSSVLFVYNQPILAWGIDVVDKNVNSLDGRIDDLTENNSLNQAGEGVVQFWGVIATPDVAFTTVGFSGLGPSVPGDTFALDNAVFVTPEPTSIALLVPAAGGLMTLRRRKR